MSEESTPRATWRNLLPGLLTISVLFGGGVFLQTERASRLFEAYLPGFLQINVQSPHSVVLGGNYSIMEGEESPSGPSTPTRLSFTDRTPEYGLTFQYRYPQLPHPGMNRAKRNFMSPPGAAVADFDGDGFMDIFVPNGRVGSHSALFFNQGGRFFVNRAEEWGVADLNSSDNAAFSPTVFDFNGDGKPDLYLAGLGCSRLFRNTGSFFEDVSATSGVTDCKNSFGGLPFDLDLDGDLDLLVLRYFPEGNYFHPEGKNTGWRENLYDARNGGLDSMYLNEGGHFRDVTEKVGLVDPFWTLDAAVGDFENNGKRWLYIANDFGPDTLFEVRDGRFHKNTRRLGHPDRRFGMNASLVDLTGTGRPHVFVTNESYPRYDIRGNFAWSFEPGQNAHDEAKDIGLLHCLWAFGAAFNDFDRDGEVDGYIANGLVSGPEPDLLEEKQPLAGAPGVPHPMPLGNQRPPRAPSTMKLQVRTIAKSLERMWGIARQPEADGFLMATFNSLPTIYTSVPSTTSPIKKIANGQVDCLFQRDSLQSKFKNVASSAGINARSDGRAILMIDTANNGVLDLLLTTGNGPIHFLKNNVPPSKTWVGFDLRAPGSIVRVQQEGRWRHAWDTGGKSGYLAFSDPRIHFGLKSDGPVLAEIRWPNGKTTLHPNLETGRYHQMVQP